MGQNSSPTRLYELNNGLIMEYLGDTYWVFSKKMQNQSYLF
jgi:hypothetical protein